MGVFTVDILQTAFWRFLLNCTHIFLCNFQHYWIVWNYGGTGVKGETIK